MDAKLQLRVQRYGWDAAAAHYEDSWRKQLASAQQVMLDMANLLPGQKVLETACGTGLVTFAAAKIVGGTGMILATDLSQKMVDETFDRSRKLGLLQIQSARMEAANLDAADNSFDRAICALGLMYVPDPLAALIEMKRVLSPGGRAAMLVWGERRNCGWADIFPIVDEHVQSEVCPNFFSMGGQGALSSSMRKAGFSDVEERRISMPLHFADRKEILRAVIDGGPVALAAKRFSPEIREEVNEQFLSSVAKYRSGVGYEIPGEFVISAGIGRAAS